ncbi:MAG: hypothetical protein U5K30_14330 [Acidimicrobiales bacterium]|nr:hypothetical protein [Acidimicrobiales bacterium]
MRRPPTWLMIASAVVIVLILVTDLGVFPLIIAVGASVAIFKVGFMMLASVSQTLPEPPPPGELRKVRIEFRCSICGSEVRMTTANDEMPDPPKHCLEEMDLVTPTFE